MRSTFGRTARGGCRTQHPPRNSTNRTGSTTAFRSWTGSRRKCRSPSHMNWDLWLGPAPERPYHATYFPGPRWYRWWDFGNGTMSDLGSHDNDVPYTVLDLWRPGGKGGLALAP